MSLNSFMKSWFAGAMALAFSLTCPVYGRGGGGGGGGGGGVPDPSNLLSLGVSTTEIGLLWTSGGGATTGFIVAYKKNATPRKKCSDGTQINVGNVEDAGISGLDYGSTYGIRVCAYDSSGNLSNGITATDSTLDMISMQIKDDVSGIGTEDQANAVKVLASGDIMTAGRANDLLAAQTSVLVRYNDDGSRDTNFSGDGVAQVFNGVSFASLAELSNGKVVAIGGGSIGGVAYLFDTDGTLEAQTTYFPLGMFDNIGPKDVVELFDGRIFILSTGRTGGPNGFREVILTRLNADLTIDNSFGTAGSVIHTYTNTTEVHRMALQLDQMVVVSGFSNDTSAFAARYDSFDGSQDYAQVFPSIDHRAYDVELDSAGNAYFAGRPDLVSGADYQCEAFKLNANGNLDTGWANNGVFQYNYSSLEDGCAHLAIDSQDRVYLAGNTDAGIGQDLIALRLDTAGNLDTDWGDNGVFVVDGSGSTDASWDATVDAFDRLIIGGFLTQGSPIDTFVVRFNK